MAGPGARNLITDVDGILVGNAEDPAARTGTTVVLPEEPAVAAVDMRGGAPGTRETDVMDPTCLVDNIDAVVLSGGSVFGLDAAGAVTARLAQQGRGFQIDAFHMPIVPAAILFDMTNGGDKDWGEAPPYRRLGRAALDAAGRDFRLGNAGAGYGATAGRLKGGLGSASRVAEDGTQVGALVAANPVGETVMPGTNTLWSWALEQDGELGGQQPAVPTWPDREPPAGSRPGTNTTIGVVAINLVLTKAEARRIAIMAHDGLARAIRPVHTPFDGDTIFVLSTGRLPLGAPAPSRVARLGSFAADCVARAIGRAVYEADALGDFPAYRDARSDDVR